MKQTIALALSLINLTGAVEAQSSGSRQPNVLFIAVDDLNSCLEGIYSNSQDWRENKILKD